MASQKMTFSVAKTLASKFVKRVPAGQRFRNLPEPLLWKLFERDRLLIRACEIVNESRDIRALERTFDSLPAEIPEPWNEKELL